MVGLRTYSDPGVNFKEQDNMTYMHYQIEANQFLNHIYKKVKGSKTNFLMLKKRYTSFSFLL